MDDEIQAHSTLGPSVAHRYIRCPGAPELEKQVPDSAGIEAAYGTCFHEAAALCAEFGLDPLDLVGMKVNCPPHGLIEFTQAMARNMQPGLDYLNALIGQGDILLVEQRLSLENWLGPDQFGTTDIAVISKEKWRIIVFDWKYGAGVPVSPVENEQAMLYFAGVWDNYAGDIFESVAWEQGVDPSDADFYDSIEVQIIIEQPRAPGGGGVWVTNVAALLKRLEKIRAAAERTREPNAPRIPGDYQCQFCRGKPYCKEHADHMLAMFDTRLEEVEMDFLLDKPLELPVAMTPEARSHILLHKTQIEGWLKDLHAAAYNDAENGDPVPGMKLVEGRRPPRGWKDEARAAVVVSHKLGEKAYTKKLLSPAQVEEEVGKALYKKHFEAFVIKGDPKPQLVAEKDGRESRANAMERFDAALSEED